MTKLFSNEISPLPCYGYIYFYVCQKTETERLENTASLRNIKLKNGEQTPSTGGSLQKHHSRSFHSALPLNKTGTPKPTVRENIDLKC